VSKNLILIGAGVGLVLVVGAWWAARRVSEVGLSGVVGGAAGQVVSVVSPANPDNVFNRAFEGLLGGSIWDVLHGDQRARDLGPTPFPRPGGGG